MVWARNFAQALAVPLAANTSFDPLAGIETGLGSQILGATVVRFRAHVTAIPNPVGSGLMIMGGIINSGPVPAAPPVIGPASQPHRDWFIYEPFTHISNAGYTNVSDVRSHRFIDVKASRRIEELDDQFQLYFEPVPGSVSPWSVSFICSTLLKLP